LILLTKTLLDQFPVKSNDLSGFLMDSCNTQPHRTTIHAQMRIFLQHPDFTAFDLDRKVSAVFVMRPQNPAVKLDDRRSLAGALM
jgi:hypothetical protein